MSFRTTEHRISAGNVATRLPVTPQRHSVTIESSVKHKSLIAGTFPSSPLSIRSRELMPPLHIGWTSRRGRSSSMTEHDRISGGCKFSPTGSLASKRGMSLASASLAKARARNAQIENDAMVYLEGQQIYTCAQCRTHLTTHDDIISKSFHGRRGRAYLFDQCVNVTIGKAEDRQLMTGLHSVCDIFCKRCKTMVGWTYARAYEASQKYKEKKFIIEKINLHMEESPASFDLITVPAGERPDRWRRRSMKWGRDADQARSRFSPGHRVSDAIFEYNPVQVSSEMSDEDHSK